MKGHVSFDVLSSATSATLHAFSGWRRGSNEYLTFEFRLYRDHDSTKRKNTDALRRPDFVGNTFFSFREASDSRIHADCLSLLAIVWNDVYC